LPDWIGRWCLAIFREARFCPEFLSALIYDHKVIEEVKTTRQCVIITNDGEPMAKPVPVNSKPDEIFGFFSAKGQVIGNVVSPALSSNEWGNLN
jgi:hypothetical protein